MRSENRRQTGSTPQEGSTLQNSVSYAFLTLPCQMERKCMIYKVLPKPKRRLQGTKPPPDTPEPDHEAPREPIDGFTCPSLRFSWEFYGKNVPKLTQDACIQTTTLYSAELFVLGNGSYSALFGRGSVRARTIWKRNSPHRWRRLGKRS